MVKKIVGFILLLVTVIPSFASCTFFGGTTVLKIMNWADYFDEDLLGEFEDYYYKTTGNKVRVLYETIDKPESMAVKIEKGKETWDLMCPSEAVLERLLKQNLLLPIDTSDMDDYNTYVSKFIRERSEAVENSAIEAVKKMKIQDPEKYKSYGFEDDFADYTYSVAYMWGNFGIMYNVDALEGKEEVLNSWDALWNRDFYNKLTMKNGPRESFAIGIIYVYREPLMTLYTKYSEAVDAKDELLAKTNLENYKEFLADIYHISGDSGTTYTIDGKTYEVYRGNDLIAQVEKALNDQKNVGISYEMDEGKDEMVRGRFAMGLAWNGDAVWAMFESELLDFAIPLEGTNFWVDSWVIPKYAKNQDIAEMFIDFICSPECAIRNMDFVGYTSAIQGNDILSWAVLNGGNYDSPYNVSTFFDDIEFEDIDPVYGGWFYLIDGEGREIYKDSTGINPYKTLAYKDEDGKLYNFEENDDGINELIKNPGDFSRYQVYVEYAFLNEVMYPSTEILDRSGIMLGYSDYSDEILEM